MALIYLSDGVKTCAFTHTKRLIDFAKTVNSDNTQPLTIPTKFTVHSY